MTTRKAPYNRELDDAHTADSPLPDAVGQMFEQMEMQRDRWQEHAQNWESVARLLGDHHPDIFRALCAEHHVTP